MPDTKLGGFPVYGTVDVLIVGSGPAGSTFARELTDRVPEASILLIDAGPRLTPRAGTHIKNIVDITERARAQLISQGPTAYPYSIPTIAERSQGVSASAKPSSSLLARPGTFLLDYMQDGSSAGLPAVAMSSNVGGMGAHWTCACPRPGNSERISFIPAQEWDTLATRAESLLRVTRQAFAESAASRAITDRLGSVFNSALGDGRQVGPMPLACTVDSGGRQLWSGPEVILGDLADAHPTSKNFTILSNTVCLRLETGDSGAKAAILHNRETGEQRRIEARVFVVAGDALRTPQVLAASSLGGPANGHYLNDQPQSVCLVELKDEMLSGEPATGPATRLESTVGVLWVPFHAPGHPFHGQVMHLDTSPIPIAGRDAAAKGNFVALGWFAAKEVRYDDCIEFSNHEVDFYGLPKMRVHYELTAADHATIAQSNLEQEKAARAFGWFLPGSKPRTMPPGSSLHYQGTTRMGENNDGTSVCDPYSQVWGTDNVFVGGNNVIPTSTACNPTLSAVALAVRASQRIAGLLI